MCVCALPLLCIAIRWLLRTIELLCQGAIHVCLKSEEKFSKEERYHGKELPKEKDIQRKIFEEKEM